MNHGENERKIKENLLKELKEKLEENGKEDVSEKLANKILSRIFYVYIDMKAKENYENIIQVLDVDSIKEVKVLVIKR